MYKTTNIIQLPKKNIETKIEISHGSQYSNNNIYNIQPGLSIFDPSTISSTPPNNFLLDLEKRMSVYHIHKVSTLHSEMVTNT